MVNRHPKLLSLIWVNTNTYLRVLSIFELRTMPATQEDKESFSDEELEKIMDMHAPKGQISVAELRQMIRENPLLVAGLVFTFGLLLGVSLRSGRKR